MALPAKPAPVTSNKVAIPLGRIIGKKMCTDCNGNGFKSLNKNLADGIAGNFTKCKCSGGIIYIRKEAPKE